MLLSDGQKEEKNMQITPIKTKKVVLGDSLEQILKNSLPRLKEQSVIVVTSKIISITEGNIRPLTDDKEKLIKQEANRYLINRDWPEKEQAMLTVKDNIVMYWAGIDESNVNGHYVLLPKDSMKSAEKIWRFLKKEYGVKHVGVIIADSTFLPLRNGSVSVGLGWCGFKPIKNYIGTPDIFGRKLQYTQKNLVDGIAISAEFVMGEGAEQQPVGVVTDIPDIIFVDRAPTQEEVASVGYPLEKDLFSPLFKAVTWEKGKSK